MAGSVSHRCLSNRCGRFLRTAQRPEISRYSRQERVAEADAPVLYHLALANWRWLILFVAPSPGELCSLPVRKERRRSRRPFLETLAISFRVRLHALLQLPLSAF